MSTNGSTNTTTPGLRDVDAAVRSVLADLLAASRPVASRPGGSDVFAGRLLSLREVEAFRGGMREVRLAPRTVVTPLAREALKRRGIDIRFVSRSEVERASNVGEWGFAIETLEYSSVVEVFRRSLLDEASEWRELGASADEAASWVAQASCRGALVLAGESSIAVYRACQVAGVRAAAADDPQAAAKAVKALGVNLLVVEPAGKPIALLKQIGATFRRGGGPIAPEWIGSTPRGVNS